jgi:hypothetical protein
MANNADDRGPLMLHWFGEPWGSEINDMAPREPTPDGQTCSADQHVIEPGDQGVTLLIGDIGGSGRRQPMHLHCFVVSTLGGANKLRSLLGDTTGET